MLTTTLVLAGLIFLAALLYSSVGHAGASGYLAAMAFVGMPTPMMRPTALVLNRLVASIATIRFSRAGFFSWRLFWPFALGSVPLAYIGGVITLPGHWYRTLVGLVLWTAAVRLWLDIRMAATHAPPMVTAILCGAGIGFLAGLTGTGGGIFLTPLMLLCRWATTKTVAATSVLFILVNSLAGLAGNARAAGAIPVFAWWLALAAALGGTLGAWLGSRRLPPVAIKRLLAVVLLVAGLHLLRTA